MTLTAKADMEEANGKMGVTRQSSHGIKITLRKKSKSSTHIGKIRHKSAVTSLPTLDLIPDLSVLEEQTSEVKTRKKDKKRKKLDRQRRGTVSFNESPFKEKISINPLNQTKEIIQNIEEQQQLLLLIKDKKDKLKAVSLENPHRNYSMLILKFHNRKNLQYKKELMNFLKKKTVLVLQK